MASINKVLLTNVETLTLSGVFLGAVFINGRKKTDKSVGKLKTRLGKVKVCLAKVYKLFNSCTL